MLALDGFRQRGEATSGSHIMDITRKIGGCCLLNMACFCQNSFPFVSLKLKEGVGVGAGAPRLESLSPGSFFRESTWWTEAQLQPQQQAGQNKGWVMQVGNIIYNPGP